MVIDDGNERLGIARAGRDAAGALLAPLARAVAPAMEQWPVEP